MIKTIDKQGTAEFFVSYETKEEGGSKFCMLTGYGINLCGKRKDVVFPEVALPSEIDGMEVIYLGNSFVTAEPLEKGVFLDFDHAPNKKGFGSKVSIKKLIIPESVKLVVDGAFKNSEFVESIVWNASCSYVPDKCFYNSKIEEIIFNKKINAICRGSFEKSAIKNIVIPNGCKRIEAEAFYGCKNLLNINLPKSIKEIGISAFRNSGINQIIWPEKCTEVPFGCFSECPNLESIKFTGNLKVIRRHAFFDEDDNIQTLDFSQVASICKVPSWFFSDMKKVKNVTMPIYGMLIEDPKL